MTISRDKLVAFTAVMAMAMLTVVSMPAVAQAQSEMTVKVPFDFYVGKQMLPSGSYNVQIFNMYVKVSDGNGHSAFALTNPVSNTVSMRQGSGQLLFTRYDSYNFLTEVRRGGYSVANGLMKSHLETQIAKTGTDKVLVASEATR